MTMSVKTSAMLCLFRPGKAIHQQIRSQQSHARSSLKQSTAFSGQNDLFEKLCEEANVAPKLGVIGCGQMSRAMLRGLLSSGLVPKSAVGVSDVSGAALRTLQDSATPVGFATESTTELTNRYGDGIVLLAIKPDILAQVGQQTATPISGLVVSILAGTTIETIQKQMSRNNAHVCPVVRVMPNTAASVGESATAIARSENCSDGQTQLVKTMMATVGMCHVVPEKLMDAVCGLSGSGPAYIFTVIDAMADAGVKCGMQRSLAVDLASQTVLGAAKMALESKQHVAELRNNVCSPAGTTIAGVQMLEATGVRAGLMAAVEAAVNRSKAIGRGE